MDKYYIHNSADVQHDNKSYVLVWAQIDGQWYAQSGGGLPLEKRDMPKGWMPPTDMSYTRSTREACETYLNIPEDE